MNQRYDEELEKIHHKIYKVRNRRYSCGKEARILTNWLRVDELLTVRIEGAGVSFGASLFANKRGYTRMDVSVISADASDIEAYFFGTVDGITNKKLKEQPNSTIEKVARDAVEKFPESEQVIKVRKRYPQHTRKKKEENISDEQMLADFESMLGDGTNDAAATVAPIEAPDSENPPVETSGGDPK